MDLIVRGPALYPHPVTPVDFRVLEEYPEYRTKRGIRPGAFPGAQVLVANGDVVYQAFGYHTYDSPGMPSLPPTFTTRLVSTRSLSGLARFLMRLHGQGKFELDAR